MGRVGWKRCSRWREGACQRHEVGMRTALSSIAHRWNTTTTEPRMLLSQGASLIIREVTSGVFREEYKSIDCKRWDLEYATEGWGPGEVTVGRDKYILFVMRDTPNWMYLTVSQSLWSGPERLQAEVSTDATTGSLIFPLLNLTLEWKSHIVEIILALHGATGPEKSPYGMWGSRRSILKETGKRMRRIEGTKE